MKPLALKLRVYTFKSTVMENGGKITKTMSLFNQSLSPDAALQLDEEVLASFSIQALFLKLSIKIFYPLRLVPCLVQDMAIHQGVQGEFHFI